MMKKKPGQPAYLVFVSHSAKDQWIARQMARMIEERGKKLGIGAFLDEKDIEGGDSIPATIMENLKRCDEFLVLISPYSIDRPWVLVEIGAAWASKKRMVAVMDKISPDELPDVMVPYKAMDINRFDEYVDQLLNRARNAGGQA